jgi:hypothetical protein
VVAHQSHVAFVVEEGSVKGNDAAAFLTPVLQSMQAQCGQNGRFGIMGDAKDATLFT